MKRLQIVETESSVRRALDELFDDLVAEPKAPRMRRLVRKYERIKRELSALEVKREASMRN
jgi:hypothetical protein